MKTYINLSIYLSAQIIIKCCVLLTVFQCVYV